MRRAGPGGSGPAAIVRGGAVRRRARAVAAGIVVDSVVGEPPSRAHPVVLLGRALRLVESELYADRRSAGAVHAAIGLGLGTTAGLALRSTTAATYVSVAGRALRDAALDVEAALVAGDLDAARVCLPALVGRSPEGLDAKEIARAVVESVAENTVDAVVAPALWALVAGSAGALGYRAVNTLDAMVGHHSARYERYGWASARLDDAANWVPARVTAGLVCLVRPRRAAEVWRTVGADAAAHPSPNAGVAEAAFAAALGLRLGGENRYADRVELRPNLGGGRPAEPADIRAALALARHVTAALCVLLAVLG